ncbi:hypothetical protein HPCPY1124_0390 [Helicobacter pylori CPY1124]|nr:hypothetical protein HPCPY1124_0390 [Helicobacter pylori CPY1124]
MWSRFIRILSEMQKAQSIFLKTPKQEILNIFSVWDECH